MMILALLEIYPQPGKRKEVIDILLSGQGEILLKPGCLSCELMAALLDEKLTYIEKWDSGKAFYHHLASDDYIRILNALEYASVPPTISFFEVHNQKGIEAIEAIRSGSGVEDE